MKDNKATQQMKMFKKEIPQMPEGYYSSGPNPNLEKFVQEHATPYDPATDDYDVTIFLKTIDVKNRRNPINDLHTYSSKKPFEAIRQYIKHFTDEGDVVLDVFSGSGGTAFASLLDNRNSIAIDISPAATFITKNYCTPVDKDVLQQEYNELMLKIKPELDWLYETRCDRCDGKAAVASIVYSQVYQCPRCLEKIPLLDCIEVKSKTKTGKSKIIRVCPHCYKKGITEEINTRSKAFGAIPVKTNYICKDGCKPQRSERNKNDSNPKKRDYFINYDLAKINEIDKRDLSYWYPTKEFPKNFARWNSDLKNFDITKVAELFTKRNLYALALIRTNISSESLFFCLSGALSNSSIMYRHREKGGGAQEGTYYIPSIFKEVSVETTFFQKYSNLIKASKYLNDIKSTSACISTQSATNLSAISSNVIDYIFTDPPYGAARQYGELNFLWEAWLDFDTNWHGKEIIVNEYRGKSENDWCNLMRQTMMECFRVLKPGRWISLCYHDTSEGTWQLIQDIMAEVGFISEKSDLTLFIDTGQKSYNQLMAQKVTKRDLVINFRKPRPGEIHAAVDITGDEDQRTFSQKARAILTEALERSPGSTADRLYDELVSRMVRKGEFERHNFDKLLREVAEEVQTPDPRGNATSRWYLLETAGEVDAAESQKESAAAERLEAFMATYLKDHPEFDGVHYSDLFEQYLPLRDKPRRLLADWLPEFFFRTPEGTWRPPKDDEERQQKSDLRTNGTLRRARRFANALHNSVPPAERDRPENAATLASWINECRRAGLYDLGKLLYEQGGHSFEVLSDKEQLEVQENYLICTRRSQANTDDKKNADLQEKLFQGS